MSGKHQENAPPPSNLRQAAESRLVSGPGHEVSLHSLQHELHVHQIELEMQNEELRRTQLALEESRNLYQQLYELAPVAYLTLSRTAQITDVNHAGIMMLGEARQNLLMRYFASFVSPGDGDRWHRFFVHALSGGSTPHCELLLQRGDGSHLHARLDFQHLHLNGERPCITLVDITERYHAEETLRQARNQSEAANLAKNDFLTTISHEVRTPMNVMLGLNSMLLETDLTPEQRQYVETMRHSGESLLAILNNILDISRIESGKLLLAHDPFSPGHLVTETARLWHVSAEEKGLTLSLEVAPNLPEHILGDPTQLQQVLNNLLGNAIKFTHQGWVQARVLLHPREPSSLLFSIADTGIGIAEEHHKLIFNRFMQADRGITRQYGGTGLGLAITEQMVKLMGGRIWLESQLNEGSTFFFTLPMELPAATPSPEEPRPATSDCSLRILLVDDLPDNQFLIQIYLKHTPYQLTLANNGREAVARVREELFDLVLMDVQMPIMDGYSATRRIRQWEQENGRPRIPIIALSAHAMEGEKERSQEAGCDLYLSKPIHKEKLLKTIAWMVHPVAPAHQE